VTKNPFVTFKGLRQAALTLCLALAVVVSASHDYRPTQLDLVIAPYRHGLVAWELSHFADKWFHRLGKLLPGGENRGALEKRQQVAEFFRLGQELELLEHHQRFGLEDTDRLTPPGAPESVRLEIAELMEQRRRMQADVEETIESEISAVLISEGFSTGFGLVFPPVDTTFAAAPGVLILSPRNRIQRITAIPLKPGLTNADKEGIEDEILLQQNLAALVEEIGGIATFPSVVEAGGNMRHAVVTAAHEWLHHWFFFRPLGQGFWDDHHMTTLNETAATLGGWEIGNRVYATLTGEPSEPLVATDLASRTLAYNTAILETRLTTDELLSLGKIEEAEAYMEERRLLLAEDGFWIRKLNQAFFAFRQSYATDPASTSPIASQLKGLRERSESLEDFLRTVAGFGSYAEFLKHLEGI